MSILDNLDGLLISNPVNIEYLTGFRGANPIEHEVYLLLTYRSITVYTNSLYIEQTKKLKYGRISLILNINTIIPEVVQISRDNPLEKQLKIYLKKLQVRKLGFEVRDLSADEYLKLKRKIINTKLLPVSELIEKIRAIKEPAEINNTRRACEITDSCFKFIITKIKSGRTEIELARYIERFIRARNGEPAFAPIVAFGTHTCQPHYIPDKTILSENNIILLDFGAKANGYCADMTRILFLEKPNPEIIHAYKVVLEAQRKSIDQISREISRQTSKKEINISGALLDKKAKSVIRKAGFTPFSHSLGHGIGLSIHEYPRLTIKRDVKITAGMVFSLEPALYVPGKFGIRIEDTVYLDNNGLEIMTKSPKDFVIINS
jgi:Xaa-Pro aminopeptidase